MVIQALLQSYGQRRPAQRFATHRASGRSAAVRKCHPAMLSDDHGQPDVRPYLQTRVLPEDRRDLTPGTIAAKTHHSCKRRKSNHRWYETAGQAWWMGEQRSEERRVGKGCGSTGRTRW